MVTKHMQPHPQMDCRSVLAKIFMVTKLHSKLHKLCDCSVLAKIFMVTKQEKENE